MEEISATILWLSHIEFIWNTLLYIKWTSSSTTIARDLCKELFTYARATHIYLYTLKTDTSPSSKLNSMPKNNLRKVPETLNQNGAFSHANVACPCRVTISVAVDIFSWNVWILICLDGFACSQHIHRWIVANVQRERANHEIRTKNYCYPSTQQAPNTFT